MIRLTNPTKSFFPTDKTCFCVPDSEDPEFADQRRRDWETRIYMQLMYRCNTGYRAYFFTLTYNNDCLPKHRVVLGKKWSVSKCKPVDDVVTIDCFSREDVRRFVRGIQQDLLRYNHVEDIDYIICSEYGSHTQRPHYHGILIIPDVVGPILVHSLIKKHWSYVYKKERISGSRNEFRYYRKTLGFVLPNDWKGGFDSKHHFHKPLEINKSNLVNASKYVCKYCTKDLSFYNKKDVKDALKKTKPNRDEYRELRRVTPFLKVSQHFGECINDVVLNDVLPGWARVLGSQLDTDVDRVVNGLSTPLYKDKTPIPQYNLRKLFEYKVLNYVESYYPYKQDRVISTTIFDDDYAPEYETRKVIKYHFDVYKTDFYKKCLPSFYKNKFLFIKEELENFFLNEVGTEHFTDWYSKFNIYDFDMSFYTSYKGMIDALAVYKLVYQNRVNPVAYLDMLQNNRDYSNKFVPYYHTESVCYADRYGNQHTDDVLQEDYEIVLGDTPRTDVNVDVLHFMQNENTPTLPLFYPNDSLDTLLDNAFGFYQSLGSLVRYADFEEFAPESVYAIMFNKFDCFNGFDDVLYMINEYHLYCKLLKLKARNEKEDRKSKNNAEMLDKDLY